VFWKNSTYTLETAFKGFLEEVEQRPKRIPRIRAKSRAQIDTTIVMPKPMRNSERSLHKKPHRGSAKGPMLSSSLFA
jgi:hypothetical protein